MPEPLRFAFTSRGDAVWGRLWSAPAAGPTPLVLVAPRVGASMHAPAVVALCAALAKAGFAAAAVDLPLQGERASRKLSARLAACATRPERAGADLALAGVLAPGRGRGLPRSALSLCIPGQARGELHALRDLDAGRVSAGLLAAAGPAGR